jgi:hypothetical protein
MKNSHLLIALMIAFLNQNVTGQLRSDTSEFSPINSGLFPKKISSALDNISISGYYRFLGAYSQMSNPYPEFESIKRKVFLGDDSNIPQLMLTIGGKPSKTTSFSTDLYLWTPLTGSTTDYAKGLNLGINLTGSHSTKYGLFNVKMGGIHWYTLSPFTFSSNTAYNRFSIFERNPWDPNTNEPYDRYKTFYKNGALTQDVRWGQQAFQGFILDGARLPQGFSFAFMHGKSQFNGGSLPRPNLMTAGKIKKDFKDNFVSINAISSQTFTDSLARLAIGFNLITTEYKLKWKELTLLGEIGLGNYYSPTASNKWGEAIDLKFQFSQKWTYFPLEVRFFQVSPNVINNNGTFWNSSIQEFNTNFAATGSQAPLIPFASSLVNIGQMTNNRKGLILNTDLNYKKNKLTFGYSAAAEITGISNRITYGHPANNLALSRFWRWAFPANVGPYGNLNKIYRGVYETATITDSITAKGFNTLEVSFKTETKLFGRDLLIFYLGSFHSVQQRFSALPIYSSKAYLQSYNNQAEFYYKLNKHVIFSNYFGFDRILANNKTELDQVSLKPKNQIGWSYSIGLDLQLAKNTGLYLRHRWMKYQDLNFSLDHYQGTETTVELKIFF